MDTLNIEIIKLKIEISKLKIAIDNLLDQRDEILTHMGDCQDSLRRNNMPVPLWPNTEKSWILTTNRANAQSAKNQKQIPKNQFPIR